MKKWVLILFFLAAFVSLFSACSPEKGIVLFNKEPITSKNALKDSKNFESGSRVYYLFIAPQRMKDEFIRVQVFKMTDKAPWGGNEVVRTKDYRLMRDERYYHTDYFTMYEKGRYVMQVFSHKDFVRPIAVNDFYVN